MRLTILALLAAFVCLAGCTAKSSPAPGPGMDKGAAIKSTEEVQKEASAMDKPNLQKAIDNVNATIMAKEKEVSELVAKLKDFSPADLMTDAVKKLNADKDRLLAEVSKLKANLDVYMAEMTKRG